MPRRPLLALALSLVLAAASYVPYRLLSGRDAERPALTGTAAPAPDPCPAPRKGPTVWRWSDPATWGGKPPRAGSAVTIPRGRRVVLDVSPPRSRASRSTGCSASPTSASTSRPTGSWSRPAHRRHGQAPAALAGDHHPDRPQPGQRRDGHGTQRARGHGRHRRAARPGPDQLAAPGRDGGGRVAPAGPGARPGLAGRRPAGGRLHRLRARTDRGGPAGDRRGPGGDPGPAATLQPLGPAAALRRPHPRRPGSAAR